MFKSKLFKYIDKADHSEKMTPEMITPYSKPASLSKTAVINSLDKAATKLKEKGMRSWLKYEKKLTQDLKYEVERDSSRHRWLNGANHAEQEYARYLKQALNGISVTLRYRNENVILTYAPEHTIFDSSDHDTDFSFEKTEFTFIAKVPIHLDIQGENLKNLLKGGIDHKLFSAFKSVIKVSNGSNGYARLDRHSLHTTIGSHLSGAQSTLKTPAITKDGLEALIKGYSDEIYKIYKSNDYDSGAAYRLIKVTKGDFTLATLGVKDENAKKAYHGDTSSEKHRSGKEVLEWHTCIEAVLSCRGSALAQIKDAFMLGFKETKQYGYAKDPSHDGITSVSRISFKENPNFKATLLKAVKPYLI